MPALPSPGVIRGTPRLPPAHRPRCRGAADPAHARPWSGAITAIPTADKKQLADVALNTARARGASYADVRIGRYLNQFINGRETKIQSITATESYGVGVRVIAEGTWGFAATQDVTPDGIQRAAEQAVAIAKANARLQRAPVELAHSAATARSPGARQSLGTLSRSRSKRKADLLAEVGDAALKAGASYIYTGLFLVNEQKYFASN